MVPGRGIFIYMHLSPQRARQLCQELHGWFGPPLLCRVPPAVAMTRGEILDGSVRFWSAPMVLKDVPFIVFPKAHRGGIYSLDGQLLPRLLVLFGHADRAWEHVPDHWKDSPQALESFLGVEHETALEVWSCGLDEKRRERARRQIKGRADHTHAEKIGAIRTIVKAWSVGEEVGMPEVAEIVGVRL